MYAIRYALAAVLWCVVVGDGLADALGNRDPHVGLPLVQHSFPTHQDPVPLTDRIVSTATLPLASRLMINSVYDNQNTPTSWRAPVLYKYSLYFTLASNLTLIESGATLNFPPIADLGIFSNINSSNNTYNIYSTGIDGLGIAFRVSALSAGLGNYSSHHTPRFFNSGQSGEIFPETGTNTYGVFGLVQVALVKTRHTQFNHINSSQISKTLELGQFEVLAKKWNISWQYPPISPRIILPVSVTFEVQLQPQTCTFTPATTTVTLPLVPAANFNPTEQDNLLPSVPFEFGVDCGSNSAIKVRAAIQDVTNDQNTSSILENTGSAQNVGVQIVYNNNPVTLSELDAAYHMPDPYNGSKLDAVNNQFKFTARYKKIDPNTDVSAGSVRAQAKIYFYYQ